jgi:predicted nucleic acid-binding protein
VTIYPDTSFFIALRFGNDLHHYPATNYLARMDKSVFLWSPWHRLEVGNTFRQLCAGDAPLLNEAEARRIIRRLETDVRLGYFLHMEADWRDVLRTANEISAAHAFDRPCRAADLCHVAYAHELAADLFVTFDLDQAGLAEATGLPFVVPKPSP